MSFTLKLSEQQLSIIVGALGKQPFEAVAPVINAIQQQLRAEQVKQMEEKAAEEAAKAPEAAAPAKAK